MQDIKKTKDQLVKEMESLRRKISALEKKVLGSGESIVRTPPKQRNHREELEADIEFIGDFDIVKAKGINISPGGLCLHLTEDLPFEFQFMNKGKLERCRAHLVWLKQLPDGTYRFGFKFTNDEALPEF